MIDVPVQNQPISRRPLVQTGGAASFLAACSEQKWTPDPNHAPDKFSHGPTDYTIDTADVVVSDGPFQAKFAPHFGQFEDSAGPDLVDQLKFAADQGFRAWEDNFMPRRAPQDQDRLARAMDDFGIEMGVFVVGDRQGWGKPTLTTGDESAVEAFLEQIDTGIACAERVGAKQMTVLPGQYIPGLRRQYQMANVVEALRPACDRLAPHGLSMVLEPINTKVDFPPVFLDQTYDAYLICKALDRPECGLLFDVYHQQIMAGNILRDMDACWDKITYFQLGDHPNRNGPGTGEINFGTVLQHIAAKGFDGIIGMEHGVNTDDAAGEGQMIARYRRLDALMSIARQA